MSSGFPKRFLKSFRIRLVLWYSFLFSLSAFLLFSVTYFLLATSLKAYDREMIQNRLRELSVLYEAGGLDELQREILNDKDFSKEGSYLVRISDDRDETLFVNPSYAALASQIGSFRRLGVTQEEQWVTLRFGKAETRFEIATSELLDGCFLQVGKSNKERERILGHFREIFALVVIPLVILCFAGGTFLATRALRPIRHLIQTIHRVTAGRWGSRAPVPQTGDEMDELVHLFNEMLEKIETLIEGMRTSLDNVAHDLRTPIARVRAGAEAVLRSGGTEDTCREALAECLEECDQILTMLNTLMDISEAESGALRLDRIGVNLATLLEEVAEVYYYLAEEKKITVQKNFPEHLTVRVDPNRMRQVIGNLLDNAIKYTPVGGRVDLCAKVEKKEIVIAVKDTGIGISKEDLPRIWDRLFRGDRSRSQRGLGLGLSVVKAIVEAHAGRVEVTSEPGIGSVFSIHLPFHNDTHSNTPSLCGMG